MSLESATKVWVNDSKFASASTSLLTDARHSASALRDTASTANALHTVCAVLDLESLQANASLPTPDDQSTSLLSKAYTAFGDGANECYVAAHVQAKRDRAIASLERGVAYLSEARARIDVASGAS